MSFKRTFFKERYLELLRRYILSQDEWYLAVAASLGQAMSWSDLQLQEVVEIHHEAIFQLKKRIPDLSLLESSALISRPASKLLEAYGMTFRNSLSKRGKMQEKEKEKEKKLKPYLLDGIDDRACDTAGEISDLLNGVLGNTVVLHKKLDSLPAEFRDHFKGFLHQLNQIMTAAERGKEIVDMLRLSITSAADPFDERKLH